MSSSVEGRAAIRRFYETVYARRPRARSAARYDSTVGCVRRQTSTGNRTGPRSTDVPLHSTGPTTR